MDYMDLISRLEGMLEEVEGQYSENILDAIVKIKSLTSALEVETARKNEYRDDADKLKQKLEFVAKQYEELATFIPE